MAAQSAAVAVLAGDLIHLRSLPAYGRHLLDAAAHYRRPSLQRRSFRLPWLNVGVWCSSSAFLALCDQSLAPRAAGEARAAIDVTVLNSEQDAWEAPRGWRDDLGFSSREFAKALAGHGLRGFYHETPSWQFYDPAARVGVQSLPAPLAIPPWESSSPLRLFLHWAYGAMGFRLAHAATLGHNGFGALLVGPSGSGKSGTTLAGLLNGLDSVGDDYVVLSPGQQTIATPVFRTFKQDLRGLARAGVNVTGRDFVHNWRGKVEFDPASLARPLADRLAVGAILIPHIAHAPRTEIVPASPREAALALAPSGVLQLPGDPIEAFRFFAGLSRTLPAFHVNLSESPAEIAARISAFLASGATHAG